MKPVLMLPTALLILLTTACSTQQLYEAGQDIRCQEYYKNEDILYETKCQKESYNEYKRKRNEAMKRKKATEEAKQ